METKKLEELRRKEKFGKTRPDDGLIDFNDDEDLSTEAIQTESERSQLLN